MLHALAIYLGDDEEPPPLGLVSSLARFFERAPHMHELRLPSNPFRYVDSERSPITLPTITTLTLDGRFASSLTLLDHLDLPNLRTFNLSADAEDVEFTAEHSSDLNPKFPKLKKLKFEFWILSMWAEEGGAAHMPRILRRCDNLKELHISDLSSPTLLALVKSYPGRSGGIELICPRLAHVSLTDFRTNWHNDAGSPLDTLLLARRDAGPPVSPIQTLTFHNSPDALSYATERNYGSLVEQFVDCDGDRIPGFGV